MRMIAAFLCGVLYGWLVRNAIISEHNRRLLAETLPPSDGDWLESLRAWDELSDEALANFDRQIEIGPGVLDMDSTGGAFWTRPDSRTNK